MLSPADSEISWSERRSFVTRIKLVIKTLTDKSVSTFSRNDASVSNQLKSKADKHEPITLPAFVKALIMPDSS